MGPGQPLGQLCPACLSATGPRKRTLKAAISEGPSPRQARSLGEGARR